MFGVFLTIGCAENELTTQVGIPTEEEAIEKQTATEMQNMTGKTGLKEFTLEELSKYNGENETIYVAYQGQVYDVSSDSNLWKNGNHEGCTAGKDITGEIENTPHGAKILKKYPVVGTLKN